MLSYSLFLGAFVVCFTAIEYNSQNFNTLLIKQNAHSIIIMTILITIVNTK